MPDVDSEDLGMKDVEEPEDVEDLEAADPEGDGDDERPEIEADERAEIDLSGVDLEAVDDDGDQEGQEAGQDDADDAGDADAGDDTGSPLAPSEGQTWGDMYVDVLAVFLIAIVDQYGDGDREMTAEDIEELANQPPVRLNESANRCMEEMGGTRDLPPGQALVVGTAALGSMVLLSETDVAGDAVGELAKSFGGGPP